MTAGLILVAIISLGYAMLARRLATTLVTAPMVFIALGAVLSFTDTLPQANADHALHLVAEVALIVLLFLDAAQIDLTVLRRRHVWPVRMLAIGMPLSLLLGTLAAWPFLADWPLAAVALAAAILTPTDAALGLAVVSNPVVPVRARRALIVESGLNDGLALPAILLFASMSASVIEPEARNWIAFGAAQLILGPLVGALGGLLGARLLLWAKDRNYTADTYEGIGALSLAGGIYLIAVAVGGNGFIAAFVGGLCFGHLLKGRCPFVYEFTESEGQLLSWSAFFLLGLAMVPQAIAHLTPASLAIILISLFVIRPLAVWVSLLGTDASPTTKLFFGWFGPRGLATALFTLLVFEQISGDIGDELLALAINAVWISALLHGLSAAPGARWYAAKIKAMGDCAETEPVAASAKPIAGHSSHQRKRKSS